MPQWYMLGQARVHSVSTSTVSSHPICHMQQLLMMETETFSKMLATNAIFMCQSTRKILPCIAKTICKQLLAGCWVSGCVRPLRNMDDDACRDSHAACMPELLHSLFLQGVSPWLEATGERVSIAHFHLGWYDGPRTEYYTRLWKTEWLHVKVRKIREMRSKSLWRWYISTHIVFLDIIPCLVFIWNTILFIFQNTMFRRLDSISIFR
jgi:hypothetical protein